jgi:aminocarboxymuconate-semialdehyde decarboxylase
VLCHLGGAIPYLAERLDRGFHAFRECRAHIDRPPSEYLREFYFDTVNFDPHALQLAIDFAGVDHILAGSDYPHQIGSLTSMLAASNSSTCRQRIGTRSSGATPSACWGSRRR